MPKKFSPTGGFEAFEDARMKFDDALLPRRYPIYSFRFRNCFSYGLWFYKRNRLVWFSCHDGVLGVLVIGFITNG
jgi:hypothetical protein